MGHIRETPPLLGEPHVTPFVDATGLETTGVGVCCHVEMKLKRYLEIYNDMGKI